MALPVVLILQKHVLISTVRRKCNRRYSETWEGSFESIESGEGSAVSPRLTMIKSATRPASRTLIPKCHTHALAHGSLAACLPGVDAAAANALASKPVRFALGALRTL